MIVGAISAVVWRFVLGSPGDVGPALFGVTMAVLAFGITMAFTSRVPTNRLFQPGREATPDDEMEQPS